jgi:hypothetical protein
MQMGEEAVRLSSGRCARFAARLRQGRDENICMRAACGAQISF